MPKWLEAIGVFLAQYLGAGTARVLGSLGMGAISITGVQITLDQIITHIKSAMGGVTSDILSILTLAGFDVFIGLVISAYLGLVTIRTLLGAFKRLGFMDVSGEG